MSFIVAYPEHNASIYIGSTNIKLSRFSWQGLVSSDAKADAVGYVGTILSCSLDGTVTTIVANYEIKGLSNYCLAISIKPRGTRDYITYYYIIGNFKSKFKNTPNIAIFGRQYLISIKDSSYGPSQEMLFFIDLSGKFSMKVSWTVNSGQVKNASKSTTQLQCLWMKDTPSLNIVWSTDRLGANLGEIVCIVEGNYLPRVRYPIELLGKYSWFSLSSGYKSYFSKYPNLMKAMKGKPTKTYYQKSEEINDTSLASREFYDDLLSFMSIRYYLGALTSGCLTTKWLLQSKTHKLYENILASPFSRYITLLTVTYKGYDLYMSY